MPGLERVPAEVRTEHLGEFPGEHAEAIARELDAAGIVWWSKVPGTVTRIWQRGVHLFVDRTRRDEALAIAERISGGAGS